VGGREDGFEALVEAVIAGDLEGAVAETQTALDDGADVQGILDDGLIAAMDEVGERFSAGDMFVPEMLRSARAMQQAMQLIRPLLTESDVAAKGNVLIGTVKGDVHDIGKKLVAMMMEGAGFNVVDLGVDVAPAEFADKAAENGADLVAMSALLTTTMPAMRETIEALQEAGLRDSVKVLVGGAAVTERFASGIEADGYAPDAPSAVLAAKQLLDIN
jgi:5-methyltetrahydrofolate--homocysteine methyltransferase